MSLTPAGTDAAQPVERVFNENRPPRRRMLPAGSAASQAVDSTRQPAFPRQPLEEILHTVKLAVMISIRRQARRIVTQPLRGRCASALAIATLAGMLDTCRVSDAAAAESPVEVSGGSLTSAAARCLQAAESRYDDATTRAIYRQAEELAARALKENPSSAEANFVIFAARGRILMADGPLKNLLQLHTIDGYLDRALELDPKYAHALAAKGGLLLDLPFFLGGDPKRAEQVLRLAVELNPTGPGTRLGLARALLRNGDASGARQELMRAAHYACLSRRAKTLSEVRQLLSEFDASQAKADVR